ncbi:TPA: glycosyltransferase family 39 protein, partial [archaeon]|nr:glycosyltransferase family 39 protein [Candidatus Naiadarchaeales archaeon SRR2090153.bin1042]
MSEHEGESKREKDEPFIILGGSAKEGKEEKKESHKKSDSEEYVIDLSLTKKLFEGKHKKLFWKVAVYVLLLIILLLAAQLRLIPIDTYPEGAPLASADPWWQYRHAREIYEQGYPGTDIKIVDGKPLYWDYLHDAPTGGPAPKEFYIYFVGYSYRYIGQYFFPTLLEYIKFTPILFAVLATLSMFLLVRELFGAKSALMAAFLFGISAPFLQRTVVGHADTDAIIGFFTLFTLFLFFRAWKKKSFLWAGAAGISLGLFGFTWPGGYTATAIILVLGAFIYYALRLLETTLFSEGPLSEIKWYYLTLIFVTVFAELILFMKVGLTRVLLYGGAFLFIISAIIPLVILLVKGRSKFRELLIEEWRGFAVLAIFLGIGLVMVAIIISPLHANLLRSFEGFLQLRSIQRAALVPGGDVIRNVLLTVAEFNPTDPRIITFSTHIAVYILAAFSLFALPIWLYKNIKGEKSHFAMYVVPFILLWVGSTYFASLNAVRFIENFSMPMVILASVLIGTGDYLSVFNLKKSWHTISTVVLAILVIFVLVGVPNISPVKGANQIGAPYVQGAIGLAERAGGGEAPNWLDFFKWARENTPKGTIFASWWDPGHAFTALAERPTVADGSQNHNHVHDLALMFTLNNSGDVDLALKLMEKYNISYFYTSSDLIGKYGAISFLGTGKAENYEMLAVDKTQVAQSGGGDLLIPYPFDIQTESGKVPTVIILNLKNNGTDADVVWRIAD